MADVKSSWLSEEDARKIVDNPSMHTGEMFPLLLRAKRRLMPVITTAERAANQAYITDPAREIERAQLVPTARGYGVTIPNLAEWLASRPTTQSTPERTLTGSAGRSARKRTKTVSGER